MEKGRGGVTRAKACHSYSASSLQEDPSLGRPCADTDKCMRMPEREEGFCGRQGRAGHGTPGFRDPQFGSSESSYAFCLAFLRMSGRGLFQRYSSGCSLLADT